MNPPTPSAPVYIPMDVNQYIAELEERQQIIDNLCNNLRAFLSHGIASSLEAARRPRPKPARPTIEDLNRAQEKLDLMHAQLEALQSVSEEMPDKMADMLRVTQMPQIQRWLEEAEREVAFIQKAIEEPEPEPNNPWDGSHRLHTLCCVCATVSDFAEPSPTALKLAMKEHGWGRDVRRRSHLPGLFSSQHGPASHICRAPGFLNPHRQHDPNSGVIHGRLRIRHSRHRRRIPAHSSRWRLRNTSLVL